MERDHYNQTLDALLAEELQYLEKTYPDIVMPSGNPLPPPRRRRMPANRGLVHGGLYTRQLPRWLEHYDLGKDLLVLSYERLRQEPQTVLHELLAFVGLPPYTFPAESVDKTYEVHRRQSDPFDVSNTTRAYLQEFFARNMHMEELLGEEWRNIWFDTRQ